MKREIWTSRITAAVLAFGLSACAMGCLVTGFELSADMGRVALICFLAAALGACCFSFKYGGLVLLCAVALLGGFLWREGTAGEEIKKLLVQISSRYDRAYGWGRLNFRVRPEVGLGYPLGIWGFLTALAVNWTVIRRKNICLAAVPALLPLLACMVVLDTVPAEGYLYGLLLGMALLATTDWARRHHAQGSGRLGMLLALPTAVVLGVLFLAVPKEGYVNHAADLQGKLIGWAEQLQEWAEDIQSAEGGGQITKNERVDLRLTGPRNLFGYSVMKVTAPVNGPVYLRGQDYNTYNGAGWIASRQRHETFTPGGESAGRLKIGTYGVKGVRYVPYYAAEPVELIGGCAENEARLTEYSYDFSTQPRAEEPGTGDPVEANSYLQLPASTLHWARQISAPLAGDTPASTARAIAAFVRASAVYDLETERMPSGHEDFARWFLEESDSGYCVHFATAAVVLLRSAGIPARYVEGYMVSCRAGEETLVTGKMAHAWAEYYDGGVWRVLEATPAGADLAEETAWPQESEPSGTAAGETPVTQPVPGETVRPTQAGETRFEPSTPDVPPREPIRIPAAVWAVGWAALLLAAVWGQSEVRIRWKRAAWNRGAPNRRALERWKQVCLLARVMGAEVPGTLETLAQKARFSQHTLTKAELAEFDAYRRTLSAVPMGKARRWLLRLIFAVEASRR